MMVHPFLLREADTGDAVDCADIMTAWITDTPWTPNLHTPGENRAFCAGMIRTGGITVADADGAVLGFLGRSPREVIALFVMPQLRGLGVGSALLRHAQKASPGLSLWTHRANTDAQRFYLRHGFTEARRTDGSDNAERLPDIEYVWRSSR